MRLFTHRQGIAGTALLAFLFAVAFPALAVARQAVDPLAYAKICSINADGADDAAGVPGSLQGKLKHAHCVLCTGAGTPPPARPSALIAIAYVAERLLPPDRDLLVLSDPAALQPLNPRAPPRA